MGVWVVSNLKKQPYSADSLVHAFLGTVPEMQLAAICLACIQPAVFPWMLPFRSNKDRPRPAHGALTEKVECFSDYMTLQIPRSHVQGLRQWLARVLHLPGTKRAPNHLASLLPKCGYLLHPAHEGGFIFRALYSACFVQKEKANYRLEIRMFHKGAKRLKLSHRYVMKCPLVTSRLDEQTVRCHPSFIQVSRPLPPPRSDGGQTPWLLSLRGELVASLEDASLVGLDVEIGATAVTIQSPRQELLQRQEVWNTSLELLPLWLVSGAYAYSFEAACPLVSSQPGSEISVHIPKQRLGLVKRGSLVEESLSPRFLQVHQSDAFTVAEDRDFVVVSIPAVLLLQDQPCQGAGDSPGTQAFYRVDLSLDFAEMVSPVHWTVENFFPCVGSREESLVPTATPSAALSTLPPGWETTLAEMPTAASSQFLIPRTAAAEELPQHLMPQSYKETTKANPQELAAPLMQMIRPAGGTWVSVASRFLSSAMRQHQGPQTPPEKADLIPHPQDPAAVSSEHTEASQKGPRPSHSIFLPPSSLSTHLFSDIPFSVWPSRPSGGPQMLQGSEPSVTLTEVPRAVRAEQDPGQPPGSPFPLGELSSETVNSTESIEREPAHISGQFPPSARSFMSSQAKEGRIFHYPLRRPQKILPKIEAQESVQNDHAPSAEGARGYLSLSTLESNQAMEGLGLTVLLGTDATFTTPRGRQPDARVPLGTSSPGPAGWHRVGPAVLQTTFPKGLLASTSEKPSAPSEGGANRTLQPESAPFGPEGQHDLGTAHTTSPLPSHTQSPLVPTETILPCFREPEKPLPDGWELMASRLAPTPESHQPPEL
ncbi:LOW QUALITY PROTEIN: uncharacterized protein C1orf127 homolog [Acomys russatus]|uniref:LOW QUALITY PROTEIN: uncharacterized protein C1orf127 homolog n=1 Tax=Acomys russatus TaxID=60746 RepID=UPI0021E1E718|nr:LOW QUALITY PROTEIN: uncharacterized protein C1orf127 homolog [Acomys russatus]